MKLRIAAFTLALCCIAAHAAPARPQIAPFEAASLDKIVTAHKGRPFLLLVWSLDCAFCKASMAELARQQRMGSRLPVITLATDPAGDADAKAQLAERLRGAGLTSTNYAFGDAPPEQLRYAVDPNWHGELPRSYWFDAQGKRRAYSGVLTAEVIAKFTADNPAPTPQ
ncbi:MAG TPA: hypothetical protein VF637_05935 [Sphingomicrobium sp.]